MITLNQLSNRKIHHLTLKQSYVKNNRRMWECECECGTIIHRRQDFLLSGKARSCGCKHPSKQFGNLNKKWRGCGELSLQHFNGIKARALKLEIPFNLTIEQAWQQFEQQNKKCALTNIDISFSTQRQRMIGIPQTASLDRIDSTKGYTSDNIQWVHKDINLMKNHFSQDHFINLCQKVIDNLKSRVK